jgi:hypothetical protein
MGRLDLYPLDSSKALTQPASVNLPLSCEELWCLLNSYCTQRSVLLVYLRERESNSRADIGAKNPNGRNPKGGSGV